MRTKSRRFCHHIVRLICLLISVGILCVSGPAVIRAQAVEEIDSNEHHLTGDREDSTNIDEPGTSESPDDLADLNIANTVTVTYANGNGQINGALRILIILTLIAIAPFLIIMLTCFTRIIVVLHFTRMALNTQTAPPNNVLIGLALFLTFFIMQPTIMSVYNEAIVPYEAGELETADAFEAGMKPIREFMYPQTQQKDMLMFMEISRTEWDGTLESIPNAVLVPSFIISELRSAFIIGFLIYIPFIVIDMVVASTLMSMGMMMLPPTTISAPFKILLFVLADGWNLVIMNVVKTYY
ncbi:MAG: flagellar type III secretion system pore protein FliP [Lachnospiraceae bacterium]|nr:flagellar type III secretion system pore protein FliP [Lachnospiraceae bacterium]